MSDAGYGGKTGTRAFPGGRGCTVPNRVLKALMVLALTFLIFMVEIIPVQAEEEPLLEWKNSFGWPGYRNNVVAAAQLDDGGYVVAVEKSLDVDWRIDTNVPVGVCVVKVDVNGQKAWEKVLAEDCGGVVDTVQTADGGLIIGLSAKLPGSSIDQLLRDIVVIKIDSAGNKVWEKTFGGEKDDYIASVELTGDGGCLVAGSSNSFREKSDYDVYLVRLDASGEVVWEHTYGGEDDDTGRFICAGDAGGFFIFGSTFSARGGNLDDIYLVKTGADGGKVWEKTMGGKGPDIIAAAQRTSDGGLVMAGTTGSFPGWENIYLAKVDASGNNGWEKTFGRDGDFHDHGVGVRETKDGGFVVLGNSSPFGAGSSVLLIKTDASGNKVWESAFQDKENVWSSDVELSGDGYIIAGEERDYDGSAAYVIKTNSEGGTLWKKTLTGSMAALLPTRDGGYLVAGGGIKSGWDGVSGSKYLIYMAKLGPGQTNQEEETDLQPVKVYLNGTQLYFDVPPVIEDGRTLVPLRAIGEALGAEVGWEVQSQTVTLDMPAIKIVLRIGDPVAYVNGESVALDVPARIIDGRTLVPLRFVSEYFGAEVQWDGDNRVITIETEP